MKNRYAILGLTALVASALVSFSCSTSTTKNHELGKSDREPASEPLVYWKKQTKTADIDTRGGSENFDLTIPMIKEWTEQVPYTDICYSDPQFSYQPGVCSGYHCDGVGQGKSDLWNSFYSGSDKVQALSNAIKGVGPKSAQQLVDAGYFRKKPRSWEAFVSELQRAADNGVIEKSIVYMASVKYGDENLVALGYQADSCQSYAYNCMVPTETSTPYSCTKYRPETFTRQIDSITRHFVVNIRNPKLQSFEEDQLSITAGHDDNDVAVSAGPYTRYNVSTQEKGNATVVNLDGVKRNLVDLPRKAVRSASFEKRSGEQIFTLNVDPNYVTNDAKDQLTLRYTVFSCKTNFFSLCLGSWKAGSDNFRPITSSEVVLPIEIDKGYRAKIVYSVARKNSPWYNDSFLPNFETDPITKK